MFNIYYQNARGLRTKTIEFKLSIIANDFEVVAITESWLCEGLASGEFFDDRYTVYRCDRDTVTTGKRWGRGVLLAVKNNFTTEKVDILTCYNFDIVAMKLRDGKGMSLIIIVVYIPCSSSIDVYNNFY